MREVTDEEVMAELAEAALPDIAEGRPGWRFDGYSTWHTDAQARDIARICLMLGQPVSDVITSSLIGALVDEVAELRREVRGLRP